MFYGQSGKPQTQLPPESLARAFFFYYFFPELKYIWELVCALIVFVCWLSITVSVSRHLMMPPLVGNAWLHTLSSAQKEQLMVIMKLKEKARRNKERCYEVKPEWLSCSLLRNPIYISKQAERPFHLFHKSRAIWARRVGFLRRM